MAYQMRTESQESMPQGGTPLGPVPAATLAICAAIIMAALLMLVGSLKPIRRRETEEENVRHLRRVVREDSEHV